MADENITTTVEPTAADGGVTDVDAEVSDTTEATNDTEAPRAESDVEQAPVASAPRPTTSRMGDVIGGPAPVAEPGAPRKEVPGGRAYEITYIARAGNPEASDAVAARVQALIEGSGGAVDNLRASETRRAAYPIHKQVEGVWVVVNARFPKETTNELDRFFKLDENVLRHMILKEAS